jgi:hypothetical protein
MNMPIPKTPETDEKRKAMIAAAAAYDECQREILALRDQLHTAVAGLESKNAELADLRKLLESERAQFARLIAEERDNVRVANLARDQAYNERADALAWLSNIELIIERARTGGNLEPFRKRRNGKHPGAGGEEGAAVSGGAGGGPVGPDGAVVGSGPMSDEAGGAA